jgi:rRNA-processing protein FCF1
MTQQVYISDTNIWIDFRNAGLLDALFSLPFKLCCTDFVLDELKDFDTKHLLARGLVVETLDAVATAALFSLMQAHNNSSLADVSCYQLAHQTKHPLLTGDGRLRKQAKADGLQVHGALWLLDQMVMHKVIGRKNAARHLQSMLDFGARLPAAEYQIRLSMWTA